LGNLELRLSPADLSAAERSCSRAQHQGRPCHCFAPRQSSNAYNERAFGGSESGEKEELWPRKIRRQSDLRLQSTKGILAFLCPPTLFSTPNLRQGQLSFAASLQIIRLGKKFDELEPQMKVSK